MRREIGSSTVNVTRVTCVSHDWKSKWVDRNASTSCQFTYLNCEMLLLSSASSFLLLAHLTAAGGGGELRVTDSYCYIRYFEHFVV